MDIFFSFNPYCLAKLKRINLLCISLSILIVTSSLVFAIFIILSLLLSHFYVIVPLLFYKWTTFYSLQPLIFNDVSHCPILSHCFNTRSRARHASKMYDKFGGYSLYKGVYVFCGTSGTFAFIRPPCVEFTRFFHVPHSGTRCILKVDQWDTIRTACLPESRPRPADKLPVPVSCHRSRSHPSELRHIATARTAILF